MTNDSSENKLKNIAKYISISIFGLIVLMIILFYIFNNYSIISNLIVIFPYIIYSIIIFYSITGSVKSIIILLGLVTNEIINTFVNAAFGIFGNLYPQASIYRMFDLPSKLPSEHLLNNQLSGKCRYFYDIFGKKSSPVRQLIDRRTQTYSFLAAFLVNLANKIYEGSDIQLYSTIAVLGIYAILIKVHFTSYNCLMNIGQLILSALIGIIYGYFYYKYTIPYVYNKTYSKEDNNLIITDKNKNLKCTIPENL